MKRFLSNAWAGAKEAERVIAKIYTYKVFIMIDPTLGYAFMAAASTAEILGAIENHGKN